MLPHAKEVKEGCGSPELHHAENTRVWWPNLSIVHTMSTQRQGHSVKQPFEGLTEQQGPLLKGFSLQVLFRAFHHNRAQLRQAAGVGGICCTFPLRPRPLLPSLLASYFSRYHVCSSPLLISYDGGCGGCKKRFDYDWYVHDTSNTFAEVKGI